MSGVRFAACRMAVGLMFASRKVRTVVEVSEIGAGEEGGGGVASGVVAGQIGRSRSVGRKGTSPARFSASEGNRLDIVQRVRYFETSLPPNNASHDGEEAIKPGHFYPARESELGLSCRARI